MTKLVFIEFFIVLAPVIVLFIIFCVMILLYLLFNWSAVGRRDHKKVLIVIVVVVVAHANDTFFCFKVQRKKNNIILPLAFH